MTLFWRHGSETLRTIEDMALAKVQTAATSRPHANDEIDATKRLALYRRQFEIRAVEKRAYDLFLQNLIKGTSHLAIGQEAIAAGFGMSMQRGDWSFCTYRGHAHTLARGSSMTGVLGELMGRECGLMGGKGGSMHLTDVDKGVMGSYAIIGAHLPIAMGAAWSAQYRGTSQVAVCFFGDGTTNIGAFHEALSMAAIWKLPVVFVCENNLYMEYTPISEVTPVKNPAADRASAYGLDRILIDGNDADVVYRTAQAAIARARAGEGPSLIEALTYRHHGHSRADPGKYRSQEEVEEWLKRDPIPLYRQRLIDFGVTESAISAMEDEIKREVDQATEVAKGSRPPADALIYKDVWADGGWAWRN
jgi:acetoin:2,6-dichlorophenolindophenol oxidoreductase subunit alpha